MFSKFLRALSWRTLWLTEIRVFAARPTAAALPPCARDCFRRLRGLSDDHLRQAESAMAAAGEPAGLVADRFRQGDEFIALQKDQTLVAFGWLTHGERTIGSTRLPPHPGRVFLYNFHTLAQCRGCGHYPCLLRSLRASLAAQRVSELIIDVNARNTASLRGVEKGGFTHIATIRYLTFFRRWKRSLPQPVAFATLAPVPQ